MSGECDKCWEHVMDCVCDQYSPKKAIGVDLDFIKRCMSEEFQKQRDENAERQRKQIEDWNYANREKVRESIRKYEKTEKGKKSRLKCDLNRKMRMREAKRETSWEERKLIRKFYFNCPEVS